MELVDYYTVLGVVPTTDSQSYKNCLSQQVINQQSVFKALRPKHTLTMIKVCFGLGQT